jgi:hypothetical protein
MKPVIRNRRVGRFIFSAGLRRDGERSFAVSSDWRDGGTVIVAIITPWVIVIVFDRPRLDALAEVLDAAEAVA